MAMLVTYRKHCEVCKSDFTEFKHKREPIADGYQIIRCCPHCGAEIEASFEEE